ncbi:Oidioi.mRNA.OKI2018_I69.chr1.g263.t1.cds [Oikopleura dioica]|uniref:Oidioi.mRNA.OKI2018_I69.chr1.g263.t1.cds n=1 Tax=Oikopleura dioica TaxID=34765 RepID=A0ABN7SPH9_OIKDI|nr:Oidioi.mRNA.OKI2018_I69.chr1.g263.t1.cds [Oikopleura dioica]
MTFIVKCKHCKFTCNRNSLHRHLVADHFMDKTVNAMNHVELDWEDFEMDIYFKGVREKNGELQIRTFWDCDNKDKETFQKTFEPFQNFILHENISDAIEISMKKSTEKKAAIKLSNLLQSVNSAKAAIKDDPECQICCNEIDEKNFAIFITPNLTACHTNIAHFVCNSCPSNFTSIPSCPFCRTNGKFVTLRKPLE